MSLIGFEDIAGMTEHVYRQKRRFVQTLFEFNDFMNPVTGARIAKALDITHVQVRALRRACWKEGIPIGSCSKGYFYAHNAKDLSGTVEHIKARCEAEFTNLRMIERIEASLVKRGHVSESQRELLL